MPLVNGNVPFSVRDVHVYSHHCPLGKSLFWKDRAGNFSKTIESAPGVVGYPSQSNTEALSDPKSAAQLFRTFHFFSLFSLSFANLARPGARMLSSGTMSDGLQIPAPFSFAQLLFTRFKGSRLRVSKGQGGSRPTSDHENTIGFQSISKRFGIGSGK